jgi:predicted RNA-binding protein with PIN domain
MHYLIDAYNVIGSHPSIDLGSRNKEQELAQWILRHLPDPPRHRFTLVFDGKSSAPVAGRKETIGPITMRFTIAPICADLFIKNQVTANARKRNMIVVSNDNDIRRHVKSHRVICLSVSEFLRFIINGSLDRQSEECSDDLRHYAIDAWMKEFGEIPE